MNTNPFLFAHVRTDRFLIPLWLLICSYVPLVLTLLKEKSWVASIAPMVRIIALHFPEVFCTYGEWANLFFLGKQSWVWFFASLSGMPSKYAQLPGIYISKYLPCQWVHTVEKSHSTPPAEDLVRDDVFRYSSYFNLYCLSISVRITCMWRSVKNCGEIVTLRFAPSKGPYFSFTLSIFEK